MVLSILLKITVAAWVLAHILTSTPSSAGPAESPQQSSSSDPIRVPFTLRQVRGQEPYCGIELYMLSDDYRFSVYTDIQSLLELSPARSEDFASSFVNASPELEAYTNLINITDLCYPHCKSRAALHRPLRRSAAWRRRHPRRLTPSPASPGPSRADPYAQAHACATGRSTASPLAATWRSPFFP
jgi:hypothetical protein